MSHRGRLNVMVHTVGRSPSEILAGFEDVDPRSTFGGGDVKYHMGATGEFTGRNGQKVSIHLVSNPSHLEAVDPVALGRVRAKQVRLGDDESHDKVFPIVLHGDAAFAGQGVARRDAEHVRPPRLPGGGDGARHRQQPDRFHHRAQGPPLLPLRLRRGAPAAGADLPRQRRGPGRRGADRADRRRLPLRLQERRGGGSDRLPPARPQRGGRPDDHPAAALQEDPGPSAALEALCPRHRRRRGRGAAPGGGDPRRARRRAQGGLDAGQEADDAHDAGLLGPLPGGLVEGRLRGADGARRRRDRRADGAAHHRARGLPRPQEDPGAC